MIVIFNKFNLEYKIRRWYEKNRIWLLFKLNNHYQNYIIYVY
jgi:hypothetical protein